MQPPEKLDDSQAPDVTDELLQKLIADQLSKKQRSVVFELISSFSSWEARYRELLAEQVRQQLDEES